ncbi:MAG: flavodoxin family protein [Oscillospiraceae bacterium]|jgi:multimeric flavodoxin WrbA|nr:flavodoxin family protein [Oscillospiraceae bacterium]
MQVILLNGSPRENGCTFTALSEVASELEKNGVETEIAQFKTLGVGDCVGKFKAADGIIIGSPVYYASINGELGALLDKVFGASRDFRGKPGAAVVSARRGGTASAFDRLNKYFTICGMPVVSSQYWNNVHGNTPEEVRQDLEGMQIMRTLGRHMAWLLKCIEAGRAAGITLPELEPRVGTNFIR